MTAAPGAGWPPSPRAPATRHAAYHELHAVEAAAGRLIVHIRNHNTANAGETLQSESTDGGRTWSVPHAIGVWGLPSHLLRLRDGRLLMTYGHRRAPLGNQARLSRDQGRTWSAPITVSSGAASGDFGYPSTVQLADGTLLTVWYELLAAPRRAPCSARPAGTYSRKSPDSCRPASGVYYDPSGISTLGVKLMKTGSVYTLLTFLLLTFAASLHAQSASGTFLGIVKDSSGAVVPNAVITILNDETGFRRELATTTAGEYEAPYIPLGSYKISAKAPGFKTVDRSGITLQVDQKARVDFTLSVGDVTETVTVTEAPPIVKADSSEFGEVVQKRAVQDLPLNGRNYVQLVHLTAGVTTGQQGGNIEGAGAFVPRGTGSFNANGQRGQNNNFMVDGIDNNESWINTTILQPSVEATQEFKVYTANAPAEFGRSSGGIVNVQTRSGTNDYPRQRLRLPAQLLARRARFLPAQNRRQPAPHPRLPPEPVRRHLRRPHQAQQLVHLRRLPGPPPGPRPERHLHRSHRRPEGRELRLHRHLRPAHHPRRPRAPRPVHPHALRQQHHPRRPHSAARAPAHQSLPGPQRRREPVLLLAQPHPARRFLQHPQRQGDRAEQEQHVRAREPRLGQDRPARRHCPRPPTPASPSAPTPAATPRSLPTRPISSWSPGAPSSPTRTSSSRTC